MADKLSQGRESYRRRAWGDAYQSLSLADQATPLGVEDLELLATSAYMLGRDGDYLNSLERAHHAYLSAGETMRAVRCAFWVGMQLSIRGEVGRGSGWLGRAQRLVEREEGDCLERGYLLFPPMFQHEASGDYAAAAANAAEATEIGERFGDADLFALAVHSQGLLLIKQGRVAQGLGLLDEAMVAVTAGELSPIVSGLVYCGVILGCQDAYEVRRAQEWTAALTKWCEAQPDMVSFTGTCLVHRAEIMQLYGAWPEAIAEAQRAGERCALVKNQSAAAQACYRPCGRDMPVARSRQPGKERLIPVDSRSTRLADVRVHLRAGDACASFPRSPASADGRARQPGSDGRVRARQRRGHLARRVLLRRQRWTHFRHRRGTTSQLGKTRIPKPKG